MACARQYRSLLVALNEPRHENSIKLSKGCLAVSETPKDKGNRAIARVHTGPFVVAAAQDRRRPGCWPCQCMGASSWLYSDSASAGWSFTRSKNSSTGSSATSVTENGSDPEDISEGRLGSGVTSSASSCATTGLSVSS